MAEWLTISHIEYYENKVRGDTQAFFGKGRNGFCDYALTGIELLLQGVGYLRDPDELNAEGDFKGFREGLRELAHLHYYREAYALKAIYNLTLSGYYTQAAILLRSNVETFVMLRYIERQRSIDLVQAVLVSKLKVKYKEQFDCIAPGLYNYYKLLCGMAHGGMASHIFKISRPLAGKMIDLDNGIVFNPERCSFIINQFSVYLLAHLEFMIAVYPESVAKMPHDYSDKYKKTVATLWELMKQISQSDQNKEWYTSVQQLIPSSKA